MADATSTQPQFDIGTVIEGNLFDLLGLTSLPEEQQDALRLTIMESIRDRVLLRIVKQLQPDQETEWLGLLDRDAPQAELEAYLAQAGVNVSSLVAEEALQYKIELAQRLGLVTEDA